MKTLSMSRFVFLLVVLGTMSVAPRVVRAQDEGGVKPPKVLVIVREMTKPGKGGTLHEKTESAYVEAIKANHWALHYLALTSLSGPDRALFLRGYASLVA
jgi:hypothetical protein